MAGAISRHAGRLKCFEALRKNNPDDNAILLSPSVNFKRTNGVLRSSPVGSPSLR